jgi:hypothetical protein
VPVVMSSIRSDGEYVLIFDLFSILPYYAFYAKR